MSLLQAILLGIVQGLTEFIPISSTAHLRIVPALLGWADPGAAFTAVIQIGTLLAVLAYFRGDISRIASAVLRDVRLAEFCHNHEAKLGWMIVLGTVPIVAAGLVFQDVIETTLRSLYVISASMIALAIALFVAEWLGEQRVRAGQPPRTLSNLSWADAVAVGFAQALALIPGSSRSGVTIMGGLFAGMDRSTAARFSFLLSLPAIFAAGVYELYKERDALLASHSDAMNLLAATVVSAVVGYASIAFLLGYLKTRSTFLFIVYRLALGFGLLGLLLSGRLAA